MAMIKVIGFRTEYQGEARLVEIDDDLKPMQTFVGGYIQAVAIPGTGGLMLVCDEEALLKDPPPEPTAHFPGIGTIRGPCFVCRSAWTDDGSTFVSVEESDLRKLAGGAL